MAAAAVTGAAKPIIIITIQVAETNLSGFNYY